MRYAVAVLVAALTLAGCGQSGNRATVQSLTEQFLRAHEAKQGAVACGVLAADTRKNLESQEGKPCAQAIGSVQISGGPVRNVQVTVTSAKVDLASGESFFFSEESAGWRIAALGCRPTSPDKPYDCQLEA